MIIFDLAALANDEHRRHFIEKPWDCCNKCYTMLKVGHQHPEGCECGRNPFTWEEDYQAYYDAADKDELVEPVKTIMFSVDIPYEIWSFQCISTFPKVEQLFSRHMNKIEIPDIKMRPIVDKRPQEQLFEEWLDSVVRENRTVDSAFSSHKPTIEMFRRKGIFVFDCNQGVE